MRRKLHVMKNIEEIISGIALAVTVAIVTVHVGFR